MTARRPRLLFVTGRLAAPLVRETVAHTAAQAAFDYEVQVVGISVAALLTTDWLARKLPAPALGQFDRVIVPGWCQGDLDPLERRFGIPFERGPKDVLELPAHFGLPGTTSATPSAFDLEIIAEINHAPRLSDDDLLRRALRSRAAGADVIDLGCVPGESWPGAAAAVRRLREEGLRVSIDSFDRSEVTAAVEAGAELVLSAGPANLDWAASLPVEFVAIADDPQQPGRLAQVVEGLQAAGRTFRADPIIEPVGFGFAASLARYFAVRREHPDWPMMMGAGNVTELSEVDSAGINFLLAAICQELNIGSVLTTEVARWSQSSVRELDAARKLAKFAVDGRRLAKRVSSPLVMLRDPTVRSLGAEQLAALAGQLTDRNYRIFVERGEIHIMNRDGYWRGDDPFALLDQLLATAALDASHAFYLGFELSKALTALRLDKQYTQDQPLRWGCLSWSEPDGHVSRQAKARPPAD